MTNPRPQTIIARRTALFMLAAAPLAIAGAPRATGVPHPPSPLTPRIDSAELISDGIILRSEVNAGEYIYSGHRPLFRARSTDQVENIHLHDVQCESGPEWLVECDTPASISNAVIERIDAQCARGCIRLRGRSARVQVRDVKAQGSVVRDLDRLPGGIVLDGEASDVTILRASMQGFQTEWGEGKYWNGDGFATERSNRRIVVSDCSAFDNSDSGFDMKARDSRFEGVNLARGNLRNFRFWESWQAATLVSLDPVKRGGIGSRAHVAIHGPNQREKPYVVRINKLVVRASGDTRAPVFYAEAGTPATVIVDSHDISVPSGTPMVDGAAADRLEVVWKTGAPHI